MHRNLSLVRLPWLLLGAAQMVAAGAQTEVDHARQAFADCQARHVAEISEAHARPEQAALALTDRCLVEYRAWSARAARQRFDTPNEQRMFQRDQDARRLKIEASLPVIERWR